MSSAPSFYKLNPLTKFIIKRPWLSRWMRPLSNWYTNQMGHRQLGLKIEDLLPEENETTQLALKRLPPREAYDRVFRLRRAFQVRDPETLRLMLLASRTFSNAVHSLSQCSLTHKILPEEEWTKPEEVCLSIII